MAAERGRIVSKAFSLTGTEQMARTLAGAHASREIEVQNETWAAQGVPRFGWHDGAGVRGRIPSIWSWSLLDVRIASGCNVFGFTDRDCAALGYTRGGAHLDLGFKFDESLFGQER